MKELIRQIVSAKMQSVSSLSEAYEVYSQFVTPTNAGEVQKRQSEKMFYLGATAFHNTFMKSLMAAQSEEDVQITMKKLSSELTDFFTKLLTDSIIKDAIKTSKETENGNH